MTANSCPELRCPRAARGPDTGVWGLGWDSSPHLTQPGWPLVHKLTCTLYSGHWATLARGCQGQWRTRTQSPKKPPRAAGDAVRCLPAVEPLSLGYTCTRAPTAFQARTLPAELSEQKSFVPSALDSASHAGTVPEAEGSGRRDVGRDGPSQDQRVRRHREGRLRIWGGRGAGAAVGGSGGAAPPSEGPARIASLQLKLPVSNHRSISQLKM